MSEVKGQIKKMAINSLWLLLSSGGVVTTLWMIAAPHVDNYLEKKLDEYHYEDECIKIGVIVKDGREWYLGPDGNEHTVIINEDGRRCWYDEDKMKIIYK